MYRSVLALLFAAVLLLGGCAAGQQTVLEDILAGIRGARAGGFQTAAVADPSNRHSREALAREADLFLQDFSEALRW